MTDTCTGGFSARDSPDFIPARDAALAAARRVFDYRREDLAQDVASEIYVLLLSRFNEGFPVPEKLAAYAGIAGRHYALALKWREGKFKEFDAIIENSCVIDHSPFNDMGNDEGDLLKDRLLTVLRSVVSDFSEKDGELYHLRNVKGHSFAEIAEILHIQPFTARMRWHRLLIKTYKSVKRRIKTDAQLSEFFCNLIEGPDRFSR